MFKNCEFLTSKVLKDKVAYFILDNTKEKMPKVKFYSTPTCPWCGRIRVFFKVHKISFTNIDISIDQKAAREMIKKSGQMAVPVVEVGKEIIVGYDEDALKKALKIK